ncbi:vacuolar protein sorting-associated protein 32 homolog 2-like [Arachis stenosperma]|uniref:vacuolar protein sorting-associated protein 32 homolog 2-like n=1 Tax=Arachis stenosperma TaxID=217475 RepID=UPI0025ACB341|nr:vacuolar protein sorting-associated protein 32 homolog 2-like [Arachis stenosperma]
MLEGAKAATETVDALRVGAATMKAMQSNDAHCQIIELQYYSAATLMMLTRPWMRSMSRLRTLEAELEELEGAQLEEQLLQPATTAPVAPVHVPAGRQPNRPVPAKPTAELAALQAEMAL